MIFSSTFLHAVTFSHVIHLDVLKSQIGLKLKVKTEISEQPITIPIYTVLPYCVIRKAADLVIFDILTIIAHAQLVC